MFTPSQLEQMPIEIERRMLDLQQRIMEDIIRRIRINDEITRSADWQIYRLNQLGESKLYIKKQIRLALGLSRREVNKIYRDAIAEGYTRDKKLYNTVLLLVRIVVAIFMLTHGLKKYMMLFSGGPIEFANPIGLGETTTLVLAVFAEVYYP